MRTCFVSPHGTTTQWVSRAEKPCTFAMKKPVTSGLLHYPNPVALRHLSALKKGDTVVIYHTGDEKSAVGLARATKDPFPYPKLGDPKRLVT